MHKIIISEDGSHTLYHEELNETYHSTHGAIQESQHVFIKMGLGFLHEASEINVLEIGFGTGLNAFLTALYAQNSIKKHIKMTSLEPYPIPEKIYQQLNFSEVLKVGDSDKLIFQTLHTSPWNKKIVLTNNFELEKIDQTLEDFEPDEGHYNLVFFDAFAPNKQNEVWSIENLNKCYKTLRENGVFVTYCAQGQFRRNLEAVGFTVNRIQGPPGKREMIRGIKK